MKKIKMNRQYINLHTGEVYSTKNLRQAIRYFKQDAYVWNYPLEKEMVISYKAYVLANGWKNK